MKKWLMMFAAVAFLAALVFKVASEPKYLNLTESEIRNRVCVGMSQQQVSAALGLPVWMGGMKQTGTNSWTYFNSTKTYASRERPLKISVIFQDGVVVSCMTELK